MDGKPENKNAFSISLMVETQNKYLIQQNVTKGN